MTSATHPLDSSGIALPDGSWPDVAGTGGQLDVIRRFCNSINRESGGDAWRDVDELDTWFRREGYGVDSVTPRDRDELLELRDAMWRAIADRTLTPLSAALQSLRLRPAVDGWRLRLVASGSISDDVAARLVEVILDAQSTGAWERMKSCQRCGWVFVDTSRNRSGRWCSMSACGAREKARAYRVRLRDLQDVGSSSRR